jgi:hypothetical protein
MFLSEKRVSVAVHFDMDRLHCPVHGSSDNFIPFRERERERERKEKIK